MKIRLTALLALLAIILGTLLIYSPHVWHPGPYILPDGFEVIKEPLGYYPYPLHLDGWYHADQAQSMLDSGFAPRSAPHLSEEKLIDSKEQGYHAFLAVLSALTNQPVIVLAQFIPAILFAITSLLVYCVFRRYGYESGGSIAVLILAFLPSNANILGYWFMVPVNISLFFLAMTILMKTKWRIWIAIVSFFTYPPSLILVLGFMLVQTLKGLKKSELFSRLGLLTFAFLSILILFQTMGFLVFRHGWTSIEHNYVIYNLVGWPVLLVGLFGFIVIYKQNRDISLYGLIFSIYGVVMTLMYFNLDYTIILPYQRLLHYWSFLLAIGTGLAVAWTVKRVSKKSVMILTAVLALIVVFGFSGYYDSNPESFAVQRMVTVDQMSVLDKLTELPDGVVLAPPFLSSTIHPLTGKMIVASMDANMPGGDSTIYRKFMQTDCDGKNNIIESLNTAYVITSARVGCLGIKQVMQSGQTYLYVI